MLYYHIKPSPRIPSHTGVRFFSDFRVHLMKKNLPRNLDPVLSHSDNSGENIVLLTQYMTPSHEYSLLNALT